MSDISGKIKGKTACAPLRSQPIKPPKSCVQKEILSFHFRHANISASELKDKQNTMHKVLTAINCFFSPSNVANTDVELPLDNGRDCL